MNIYRFRDVTNDVVRCRGGVAALRRCSVAATPSACCVADYSVAADGLTLVWFGLVWLGCAVWYGVVWCGAVCAGAVGNAKRATAVVAIGP